MLIAVLVLAAMIAIALLIQALVHWHPGGNGAPHADRVVLAIRYAGLPRLSPKVTD